MKSTRRSSPHPRAAAAGVRTLFARKPIAPASEIVCVRGLTDPSFYELRDQGEARRALGLPADRRVVLVSGGGWSSRHR